MSVQIESVEMLREWLAEGSAVRSANASADHLAEKLGSLGLGQGWPEYPQKVDEYARSLESWFAGDAASESTFTSLTRSDDDAGTLIDWLLQLVGSWERATPLSEGSSAPAEAGGEQRGHHNSNFDGTPGTEYYLVDSTGAYLFAGSESSVEWLPYEERQKAGQGALEDQFKADLPDPEKLADAIVTEIGAQIGSLIAEEPELAEVDAETLAAWIAEDVEAALNELGETGWEVN